MYFDAVKCIVQKVFDIFERKLLEGVFFATCKTAVGIVQACWI